MERTITRSGDGTGVAIIGMACRFPGATSVNAFWSNLCRGVESITFFSDEELVAAGVDASLLGDPSYVKAAPILTDIDRFDAPFFGYSPREAAIMDPQHRLFLEVAWETFEDAGYCPETYNGSVGVFAGGGGVVTSYLLAQRAQPGFPGQTAGLSHLGNDKDFLSTRVSYKLNLTGPSVTIQTACSTSLVAVHLACQSLLRRECDMVLAGAATVRIPHVSGYLVEKGNVHSMDGHCRAFDAGGQGTVFGSGVAAVLLKDVARARADGDHVYAVIKGTAVNNDGGRKVSYTAPSVAGQARAMRDALAAAGFPPATIRYVECHATGTVVGDPLEIQALAQAFGSDTAQRRRCAVGSVKTNIGHPEQTAGLAGLIKTALAVRHGLIPPTLHFVTPNPKIDFEQGPFYVNTELIEWPRDAHPRRAAVNSLGIGGTNAFAVLEEASEPPAPEPDRRGVHVFTLSAKTESGVLAYGDRVRAFIEAGSPVALSDLCYSTNVSRSHLPYRLALLTHSTEDLTAQLAELGTPTRAATSARHRGKKRPVAFLFTGQGSQYPGMAQELYETNPTFRQLLDTCAAGLQPFLDKSLLDVLFARGGDSAFLHETAYTQPALFTVEYALAQLWRTWGLVPAAALGHSVGELVAACVAGVFPLEDALRLVAERGKLMQSLPRHGAMAVVFTDAARVRSVLSREAPISIAAINGPQNTVISGDQDAVAAVLAALRAQGIAATALPVSHAFHSPLMDPILDRLEAAAGTISAHPPQIPLVSNVTGKVATAAPTAEYWREHARSTVRFADGLRTLHELGFKVFLEVGPGAALLGMGRQCFPAADITWLSSVGKQKRDWQTMLESVKALYLEGLSLDWSRVHAGAGRRRVSLPTYPFERKRYWLDGTGADRDDVTTSPRSPHPLLGIRTASGSEIQYEALYGVERFAYLRDHRIHGRSVLPTAAGLEAALAAGQAHFGGRAVQVEDLTYHRALVLPDTGACQVRLVLRPDNDSRIAFRLTSRDGNGNDGWQTHMSGVLSRVVSGVSDTAPAMSRFDPQGIRASCPQRIPPADYYATVRKLGLEYGESFRGVQELWHGTAAALGRIRLPAGELPGPYEIHPAFLDACLHVYPAAIGEYGQSALGVVDDTYLPVGIERFRVYQTQVAEGWTHAVVRNHRESSHTLVLDVRVYDADGSLVAALDALALRRVPRRVLTANEAVPSDWLYHVRWEDQGTSTPPRTALARWLIFADRGGVGAALAGLLEDRGDWCDLVFSDPAETGADPTRSTIAPTRPEEFRRLVQDVSTSEGLPCRGVVYLWGLDIPSLEDCTADRLADAEARLAAALYLTQALGEAKSTTGFAPRLWFVTRNVHNVEAASGPPVEAAQAPLWGLGRTIALEYPTLWGGLIDLPHAHSSVARNGGEVLARELLQPDCEAEVALRGGRRFAARLARLPSTATPAAPLELRADATYVITGGLGTLGLCLARWLVERHGVRSLILAGRRATDRRAGAVLEALRARGAVVRAVTADVSEEDDVRRLLDEARRQGLPVKGVVHCAGVVDDGILSQMDRGKLTRVTAPKVRGSWLLHRYTRDLDLDFFLLYSSLLSLTGSAGQANYTAANAFLDALAQHRHDLGLPATVVNWGPWAKEGMAAATGVRGAAIWRARGTSYIAPDAGLRVLEYLMSQRVVQAAVSITDWPTYLRQFPEPPALYDELAPEVGAARKSGRATQPQEMRTRLREAAANEQRSLLLEFVRAQVMAELGFKEPIDPRQPLNELGLDSLMSVNVANRLERSLEIAVPVAKLIRGPSVAELVDELYPHLAGTDEDSPAAEPLPADATSGRSAPASITAADGWLVFPRPNRAAKVRLFCFHYAGGGAAIFRPWAEALDPAVELVAIEPPGRGGRADERLVETLDAFVSRLIPVMSPYLDKPFAFFGHCLGALTLFETARWLLARQPVPLEHVFVSGARPPHLLQRDGPFELELLAHLLRHPEFDPCRPGHEQSDDVFADMLRHFNIGATDEFLKNPELRRLLLPLVRADFAMAFHYRYSPAPPWEAPVTCFAGLGDPYVRREEALEWGRYTNAAFRLLTRATAHFLVVDDRAFILETINRELGGRPTSAAGQRDG